jgi:hypothetical protein
MSDSKFLAALQAAGIQGTVREKIIQALRDDLSSDTPPQRHVPLRNQIINAQANSGHTPEARVFASPKFKRMTPDQRIQAKANLGRMNLLRSYKDEAEYE